MKLKNRKAGNELIGDDESARSSRHKRWTMILQPTVAPARLDPGTSGTVA